MAQVIVRIDDAEEVMFAGEALEPAVNLEEAARAAIVYLGQFLLRDAGDPLDKHPDVRDN